MKKFSTIIVIILSILSISFFCYSLYIRIINFNKSEDIVIDKKRSDTSKEVLLQNDDIKNDLLTKFYSITNSNERGVSRSYDFRYDGVFGNVFNDFNDDLKLRVVLDYLYSSNSFEPISEENKNDPRLSYHGTSPSYQISANTVKEWYKKYYGNDNVVLKSIENVGCYGYDYSPEKELFYKTQPSCGGETDKRIYSYVNRFVVDGDNIYLYVNFGSCREMGGSINKNNIFTDLDSKNLYEKYVDTKDAYLSNKIDKDNYYYFDEYRFIFKKDDTDNYYFVSIEKV